MGLYPQENPWKASKWSQNNNNKRIWMLWHPRVGCRLKSNGGSPDAGAAQGSPGEQNQLVNTKGSPCPGQAGQSPACVSLKPWLRILSSEHPSLPYTRTTKKVMRHKEALSDYRELLCSPPYTCIIIILLHVHLIFITSRHGKNPNPFRNNSLLTINVSVCEETMREEGRFFGCKNENAPHCPRHTNRQKILSSQFTSPMLQIALPEMGMNLSLCIQEILKSQSGHLKWKVPSQSGPEASKWYWFLKVSDTV